MKNKNVSAAIGVFRRFRQRPSLLILGIILGGILLAQASSAVVSSAAQEPSSVTFGVIGDFGSNDSNELAVANLVKSWNPDFIVTVGDNNYPDGEASTIDANIGKYYHQYIHPYTGSYGAGATTNRFWPSVGNRDWENTSGARLQPYLNYFTLPGNERYYDFVQGPVHFFMLDSDSREPDGVTSTSVQAQWLQNRLAISNSPWKIVILHHPPFSSRTSWSNLQWPFREWGADAVISGHAHIYERVLKDGFPYFICGLGGESLGSFSTAIEGSIVRYGSDYGAMKVTATMSSITFQFFTRTSALIDTYTINRNASVPNAPTNLSATTVSPSRINLAWTDHATNEDGFQIERSTDGVGFNRIATVSPNINAYADINLQPATTYHYRVRAFASDQISAYTNTATATTTMTIPNAPSNLAASTVSASQINLSWTDNATNEDNFEVERCVGASCTNFAWIADTSANATSFSNTGLTAGTTYRYRVRASSGSGDSGFSNIAQATTTTTGTTGKPNAPSNMVATAVSTSQINLSWVDNSSNETGFKVYRSTDGVNFSKITTLGANVTSHSDVSQATGTTYYYYVRSYNSFGDSANSNTSSTTTFPPPTAPPAAPTNLVATALSSTEIRLTWTDNATNEKAFKVYRSLNGSSFTEIAKPGPNATSYIDAGRSPNTIYYYRVRSYNDAGSSAYSNTASARTP